MSGSDSLLLCLSVVEIVCGGPAAKRLGSVRRWAFTLGPAAGCEVAHSTEPAGGFVAACPRFEALRRNGRDERFHQLEKHSTILVRQPLQCCAYGSGPCLGDPPAQGSARSREHDRPRPAVPPRLPLDRAGASEAINEPHGAGVSEAHRLGQVLRRATGKELFERNKRSWRGAGHVGGGLSSVTNAVGQGQRQCAEDVDQVWIA